MNSVTKDKIIQELVRDRFGTFESWKKAYSNKETEKAKKLSIDLCKISERINLLMNL